jgi:hypothetical protein
MTITRRPLAALLLALPLAALAQADAGNGPPPDQDGHHRGPPPEAIAACKGKAVGTQASFTDRAGRTISGPCTQMGDVVAIPPPKRPNGQDGAPPKASQ